MLLLLRIFWIEFCRLLLGRNVRQAGNSWWWRLWLLLLLHLLWLRLIVALVLGHGQDALLLRLSWLVLDVRLRRWRL